MNHKPLYLTTALIAILVLITGCNGIPLRGGGTNVPTITIPNIYTGTQGVNVQFVQGFPPPRIIEGKDFIVTFELTNAGAATVQEGAYMVGIEKPFVELKSDAANMFELAGKSINEPLGVKDYRQIALKAKLLPPETETYTTTITGSVCYNYETKADISVCLDPDPYGQNANRRKFCQMTRVGASGGQGAPVTITSVEPRFTGTAQVPGFEFTIGVSNAGRGQVLAQSQTIRACEADGPPIDALGKIEFRALLGEVPLLCGKGDGEELTLLTLNAPSETIRCRSTRPPQQNTAYQGTLHVEMRYGYSQTVSTQVIIGKDI